MGLSRLITEESVVVGAKATANLVRKEEPRAFRRNIPPESLTCCSAPLYATLQPRGNGLTSSSGTLLSPAVRASPSFFFCVARMKHPLTGAIGKQNRDSPDNGVVEG